MKLCQPGQMPPSVLHVHIVGFRVYRIAFVFLYLSHDFLASHAAQSTSPVLFHWSRLKMTRKFPPPERLAKLPDLPALRGKKWPCQWRSLRHGCCNCQNSCSKDRRSRVCCGDIQAAKVESYAGVLSKSPWNLSATTERHIA